MAAVPTPSDSFKGIACMIAGAAFLTLNDGVMKWMTASYPIGEVIFIRSLFVLIPVAFLAWRAGGLGALRVHDIRGQAVRTVLSLASMGFFVHRSPPPTPGRSHRPHLRLAAFRHRPGVAAPRRDRGLAALAGGVRWFRRRVDHDPTGRRSPALGRAVAARGGPHLRSRQHRDAAHQHHRIVGFDLGRIHGLGDRGLPGHGAPSVGGRRPWSTSRFWPWPA